MISTQISRLVGVLIASLVSGPALAHSELRASTPASGAVLACAPQQIELQFNEGVRLTALRLHRVDGAEVELPRRQIQERSMETIPLPPLEPGAYRADWRIISADGHPVGGAVTFQITGSNCP